MFRGLTQRLRSLPSGLFTHRLVRGRAPGPAGGGAPTACPGPGMGGCAAPPSGCRLGRRAWSGGLGPCDSVSPAGVWSALALDAGRPAPEPGSGALTYAADPGDSGGRRSHVQTCFPRSLLSDSRDSVSRTYPKTHGLLFCWLTASPSIHRGPALPERGRGAHLRAHRPTPRRARAPQVGGIPQ